MDTAIGQPAQMATQTKKATPTIKKRSPWFKSSSYRRLERSYPTLYQEHQYLVSLIEPVSNHPAESQQGNKYGDWVASSEALLNDTRAALENNSPDLGWSCFKEAAHYHLYGLAEKKPDVLPVVAASLREEASTKLGGWRRSSILELLKEDESGQRFVNVENLVEAKKIIDDYYDTVYETLGILRQRLIYLTVVTFVVIVFWIFILPMIGWHPIETHFSVGDWVFWLSVIVLGLAGAVLSVSVSATANLDKRRIPTQLADHWITTSRFAVAALTALIAVILLTSGFINIGTVSPQLILVVALASGFSERLVLLSLQKVSFSEKNSDHGTSVEKSRGGNSGN